MSDQNSPEQGQANRRSFLKGAAVVSGAATLGTVTPAVQAADLSKVSGKELMGALIAKVEQTKRSLAKNPKLARQILEAESKTGRLRMKLSPNASDRELISMSMKSLDQNISEMRRGQFLPLTNPIWDLACW